MSTVQFEQLVSRGCGLDVHQKTVVAIINGEGLKRSAREFGTFTSSLTELKDWLLENGITHVAMMSTGVYLEARLSHLRTFGDKSLDCQYQAY